MTLEAPSQAGESGRWADGRPRSSSTRRTVEATVDHLQSALGEKAWTGGMNPEIPETKILDNPYTYTEFRSADTHRSNPADAEV